MTSEKRRWNKHVKVVARVLVVPAVLVAIALPVLDDTPRAQAPAAQAGSNPQKTVWYFYRVKWGFQSEFETLFARNHLPVLRDQIKTGRIVSVKTYVPTYHGDGRADWTFAVAITYKDTAALVGPSGEDEITKRLFPDRERFRKEEQRRFELLDAHWDIPLNELDMK